MTDELKMVDELDSWIEAAEADNQECGPIFIIRMSVVQAAILSKLAREAIKLRKQLAQESELIVSSKCISQLKQELATAQNHIEALKSTQSAEFTDMQKQLAEAMKDAERYRWLQHQKCDNNGEDESCYLMLSPRDLDCAIDAAISDEQRGMAGR